jgi:hypothetical protein
MFLRRRTRAPPRVRTRARSDAAGLFVEDAFILFFFIIPK